MRGVNNGHIWIDGYGKWTAYNALPSIAMAGANLVRIPWRSNSSAFGLKTPNDLETINAGAIANKLVPIASNHSILKQNYVNLFYLNFI